MRRPEPVRRTNGAAFICLSGGATRHRLRTGAHVAAHHCVSIIVRFTSRGILLVGVVTLIDVALERKHSESELPMEESGDARLQQAVLANAVRILAELDDPFALDQRPEKFSSVS